MNPQPPRLHFVHRPFEQLSLRELYDILWLRNEVFVFGQKITAEPEIDGLDPACVHVFGSTPEGRIVATARLFMNKSPCAQERTAQAMTEGDKIKVGRVAIANNLQRMGCGTALMEHVHEIIADRPAALSAQLHLRAWYERLGWEAQGEVYEEAEIPHIHMERRGKPHK